MKNHNPLINASLSRNTNKPRNVIKTLLVITGLLIVLVVIYFYTINFFTNPHKPWYLSREEYQIIESEVITDFVNVQNQSGHCPIDNTEIYGIKRINKTTLSVNVSCACGLVCGYSGDYILEKKSGNWVTKSYSPGLIS